MTSAPRHPALPDALRRRVLQASLGRRAPGRYSPAPPSITPLEALTRATRSFDDVLAALTEEEWLLPVLRGLDVQGLVGHLVGVEGDVQRALRGDARVADADHVGSTQPHADEHRGRPPAETLAAWRDAVAASLAAFAAADPEQGVGLHTMRLRAASLCVVRTFELWSHEGDIRLVTGRAPSLPDHSMLTLMTDLAARGLPVGAARTGLGEPIDLRLVLTGPGGGTWEVRLGPDSGASSRVGVVTDAVGFCRLAANRISPGELVLDGSGDRSHLDAVLAATAALALD
ncbi:MAG: maleylpyruvate isomerase family mycothiol-dependent enzyme [Nocardioidaceae bacterium]